MIGDASVKSSRKGDIFTVGKTGTKARGVPSGKREEIGEENNMR